MSHDTTIQVSAVTLEQMNVTGRHPVKPWRLVGLDVEEEFVGE